jgi:hypothetical protein
MAAQLEKVADAAREGKAVVQVIPFSAGKSAAAQDSNFVLWEFDEEQQRQPPVVFVEGLMGNQYLEQKAQISRYREAIDYLRDAALSPGDSVNCIDEAQKRFSEKL